MSIIHSLLRNRFRSAGAIEERPNERPQHDTRALYLDLMKRCLTNYIYDDDRNLMTGVMQVDQTPRSFDAWRRTPQTLSKSSMVGFGLQKHTR